LLLNSLKSNCVPHLGSELVLYGIPGGGISDEEARETVKKASSLNISIGFTERVLKETVYLEGKTYLSTEQKQAALIEENIKVAIKEFFLTGRFLVAKKILPEMSWDEIYAMLLSMAQNERSICAYSFMWLLQKEEETCQRHLLHAEIAWETFKHVDGEQYPVNGAEALRFFHRHRAAELAPDNIEIQEKLLSLYLPNDPKFDLKETKERAKHILATNPASSIAQKVLWEITNCLGE